MDNKDKILVTADETEYGDGTFTLTINFDNLPDKDTLMALSESVKKVVINTLTNVEWEQ